MPRDLRSVSWYASRSYERSTRCGETLMTIFLPSVRWSSSVVLMHPPCSGTNSASSADVPPQSCTMRRSDCHEMSISPIDMWCALRILAWERKGHNEKHRPQQRGIVVCRQEGLLCDDGSAVGSSPSPPLRRRRGDRGSIARA